MNNLLKAFRCKRCKKFESDSLSEMYRHLEDKHNPGDILYLPKASEKCTATYYPGLNSLQQPLPCELMYGHLGPHQYNPPVQYQTPPQNFPNMFTGWREA